jgi:PncC family amidohydrolase
VARAGSHDALSRLRERGLTVAVAESSAGGLIAAALTAAPGSSAWFRGGVVAYDAPSKTALLGIPASLFEERGSVSAEAAQAMAEAARGLFGADLGIGETGIAGPGGGSAGKPVGLTYVAVASAGGTQVREWQFAGSRAANREAAVAAALELLAAAIR